jgi:hypothetical protein
MQFCDFSALRKAGFQWNMTGASSSMCRKARVQFGLVRRQAKLCRTATQAMPHIVKAAAQAVATCQSVFADRRWNCTSIENAPSFTPDITTGTVTSTKNAAFITTENFLAKHNLRTDIFLSRDIF